jgi:transposase
MCQRIRKIEGIGSITATALVAAVGDQSCFKNGRQFAAWLGLVPKQGSSGGKSRFLGISKRGNRYLRTLLIQGARAVLGKAGGKQDARSAWINRCVSGGTQMWLQSPLQTKMPELCGLSYPKKGAYSTEFQQLGRKW